MKPPAQISLEALVAEDGMPVSAGRALMADRPIGTPAAENRKDAKDNLAKASPFLDALTRDLDELDVSIIRLIASGATSSQIAEILHISVPGVSARCVRAIRNIRVKLNEAEAVLLLSAGVAASDSTS